VTVLVTRPAEDSETTIAYLAARGIAACAAPAMMVRFVGDVVLPADCRALVVTSTNAIRAIRRAVEHGQTEPSALSGISVYTVGDRTATAAREAGFADVRSASGDAKALFDVIRSEIAPGDGTLVWPGGRDVASDLEGNLAAAGYKVARSVVYETVCAETLPPEAVSTMDAGTVEAVLLYSPKSAHCFCRLAAAAGLGGAVSRGTAITMSQAVAERATAGGFGHTIVAERPDESALLEALERFLNDRRPV